MSKEEAKGIADRIVALHPRKIYPSGDNDMIKCIFCARLYRPGDKLTICDCPICEGDATKARIASDTLYDHCCDLDTDTINTLNDELIGSGFSFQIRQIARYRKENIASAG